jgi:hypothetical protein
MQLDDPIAVGQDFFVSHRFDSRFFFACDFYRDGVWGIVAIFSIGLESLMRDDGHALCHEARLHDRSAHAC